MNIEPVNEVTVELIQKIQQTMLDKSRAVETVKVYKLILQDRLREFTEISDSINSTIKSNQEFATQCELAIQNLYKEYHKIANELRQKK